MEQVRLASADVRPAVWMRMRLRSRELEAPARVERSRLKRLRHQLLGRTVGAHGWAHAALVIPYIGPNLQAKSGVPLQFVPRPLASG